MKTIAKTITVIGICILFSQCDLQKNIIGAINESEKSLSDDISSVDSKVENVNENVVNLTLDSIKSPDYFNQENTLGYHLEGCFKTLRSKCNFTFNKNDKYSNIPENLRELLSNELSEEYTPIDRVGSLTLFGGIYDSPEYSDNILYDPDYNLNLFEQEFPLGVDLKSGQIDNTEYIQTCAGSALAALNMNFNIPPGEINAAIKTETDNSTELYILGGSFISPMHTMLTSNNNNVRNWINFKLWKNYETNEKILELDSAYYMKGFLGYLTFLGTRSKFEFSSGLDANISADISVVSLNTNVNGSMSKKSSTNISKYDILISKDTLTQKSSWGVLPSPVEIKDYIAGIKPSKIQDNNNLNWYQYDEYYQTITVWGIPYNMCEDCWTAEEFGADSLNPRITSAEGIIETPIKKEGCRFVVQFNPDESFFDSNESYNLNYSLNYYRFIDSNELSIRIKNLSIQREKDLRIEGLIQPSAYYPQVISAGIDRIEWELKVPFSDGRDIVDNSKNVIISVKDNEEILFMQSSITGDIKTGLINFDLKHRIDSKKSINGTKEIEVVLSFKLPLNNNGYTDEIEKKLLLIIPKFE